MKNTTLKNKDTKKIFFLIYTSLEANIACQVSEKLHKKTTCTTITFHLRPNEFKERFPELIKKMEKQHLIFTSAENDYPRMGASKNTSTN